MRTLVLLLLATSVSAADFKVDPIAPTTASFIRVTSTSSGCGTIAPDWHLEGSTIVVDSHFQAAQCVLVPNLNFTVNVGVLPAGVYEVETRRTLHPERRRLIVRPASLPLLDPAVGPITGADGVRVIDFPQAGSAQIVSFDGVRATVTDDGRWIPPPHPAGTVDVAVTRKGITQVIRAGFTYFDPAAPPDPEIFEPLLFPMAFHGPGAFGSQWVTQTRLVSGSPLYDSGALDRDSASGVIVYAARGGEPLSATSIRDGGFTIFRLIPASA